MYSPELRKLMGEKGIEVWDRVRVEAEQGAFEGIVMPRIEYGDPDTLILKLKNGYNVGIKREKIREMELLEKGERKGEEEEERGEGDVVIISTGGTIASRVDYRTGGVYASFSSSYLLERIPEIRELTSIRTKKLFSIMSEDMLPENWREIAREVYENREARGVVITHGTDTMHFTAAALSFLLPKLSLPVALTGAQRSPDRPSSDAFLNLLCSVRYALSDAGEVAVVMHGESSDTFCYAIRGTHVRKMHTSRRDAFKPINDRPLMKIWPDRIEKVGEYRKRAEETVLDDKMEERVGLLHVYPGADPRILEFFSDYRGLVIAGTGLGHVPTQNKKSWIPGIKSLVERGVFVAVTSQTLYGSVHPYVYHNLRVLNESGAVHVRMTPETAYVKLMWVLGHEKRYEKVKELMLTDLVGELSREDYLTYGVGV